MERPPLVNTKDDQDQNNLILLPTTNIENRFHVNEINFNFQKFSGDKNVSFSPSGIFSNLKN